MTYLTVSGKTVDEAIVIAVNELQITRERLSYRIVQQPKRGFLGVFGSQPAKIEAHILPDPVEIGQVFLEKTITLMGMSPAITLSKQRQSVRFNLTSDQELGRLIGKRGQTLEALEYLTNLVSNRQDGSYTRIELDAENYRDRRKLALEQLASRVAKSVITTNEQRPLESMNSLERKIIHTALQHVSGVKTVSNGKGSKRHITVIPYKE